MNLLENPFYILNANLHNNRSEIFALAEEKNLVLDPDICHNAKTNLTIPQKRISSEMAWLLGVEPKRAKSILSLVSSAPEHLLSVTEVESITRANLLTTGLLRLQTYNIDNISQWVIEIAKAFELINADTIIILINQDRIIAKFSELKDKTLIEDEIHQRRRYYRNVIKIALDKLEAREIVQLITNSIESTTNCGKKQGLTLITDMVDIYEVEAQQFLTLEKKNIIELLNRLHTATDTNKHDKNIAFLVDQLIRVVKNWDSIAQPMQVRDKSQGRDHDESINVAMLIREAALHILEKHEKLIFATKIITMLQEVFAEVDQVIEKLDEDLKLLATFDQRQNDIIYEANIGLIFKDRLSLSLRHFKWNDQCWPTNTIQHVRWWQEKSTFTFAFGSENKKLNSVQIKSKRIFYNFLEKFIATIGMRILEEYLKGLRNGLKYSLKDGSIISDEGITLVIPLSSAKPKLFFSWNQIVIARDQSFLYIQEKQEHIIIPFSYKTEDNLRILELAILVAHQQGSQKLSDLLN